MLKMTFAFDLSIIVSALCHTFRLIATSVIGMISITNLTNFSSALVIHSLLLLSSHFSLSLSLKVYAIIAHCMHIRHSPFRLGPFRQDT